MGKLTHTVKGPIASFRSADNADIESLKLHFLPKQEGSGDPSPTNIRPITGWTGCNLFKAKKNLLDISNAFCNSTATLSNGVVTNNVVDTRAYVSLYIEAIKKVNTSYSRLKLFRMSGEITEAVHYTTGVLTVSSECEDMEYLRIKHNGSSKDFAIYFPLKLPVGAKFAVTLDITGADISTIGGFSMTNFHMEVDTASDTLEQYEGSTIPIAFPSTRNLLDTSTHETDTHIEKKGITFDYNSDGSLTVNGIVDSDASSGPQYRMAMWTQQETGNFYLSCIAPFSTSYNEVYVWDNDLGERPRKWDGETASQSAGSNRQLSEVQLIAGHSYSVNIRITRGTDKTYSNNKFYVMILRSTDTNTNYEPYGFFYGGYIDLIRGKLIREYTIGILDGTETSYTISGGQGYRFGTQRGYTSLKGDFNKPVLYASTETNPTIRSNMFLTKPANSLYGGEIGIGIGGDGSTIWMCYGEAGMTEEKIRTFLSSHPVQIAYKLATPIEYNLTPQQIQTFLDYNNFWSDMNDDTEVEYCFADRMSERKLIMDTPHIVTATSAPVVSFNTDIRAPLEELKVHFTPIQEGIGDPSPQNVRLITGWTGFAVVDEENHFPINITNFQSIEKNGLTVHLENDGSLYFSGTATAATPFDFSIEPMTIDPECAAGYLGTNIKDIGQSQFYIQIKEGSTSKGVLHYLYNEVLDDGVTFININESIYIDNIRIVLGNGSSNVRLRPFFSKDYYQLDNHCKITWSDNGIIYGGYADLIRGKLVAKYYLGEVNEARQYTDGNEYFWYITAPEINIPSIKSENSGMFANRLKVVAGLGTRNAENQITFYANGIIRWKENGTMSLNEYNEYLESNPIIICYEMLTPIEYDLTSEQIKTLKGANNVWSTANGNIDIKYWTH